MIAIVLLGLMMVSAKLWFDVTALRQRVAGLEIGDGAFDYPDVVRPSAPPVRAEAFAIAPEPEPAPRVADVFVPDPVEPAQPVFDDEAPLPDKPSFGFEDLFGRKLPIWAGGVTLAVAGFLIVKYSIDAGLLSPAVRVVCGLLFGTGLIFGAEAALRADAVVRDPRVRQALAGAGVATLYASILVAANLYHLIGPVTAFAGMALTTALAGGLSLRFGAPSAVLGLVGGLAAPALVGSGSPDVPLLSAYLALAVGGLCALSRTQRWMWLGVAALIGGLGWGALLILGGALDAAAALSVGAYMLLLGVGLPVLAFAGPRGAVLRIVGSLAACAQLAALVATGGFAPLEWGLFALISIAIVWLSRREAALAELPAAGLTVALLLVAAWPDPGAAMLATVIAGIAAIYGGPAAWRLWRDAGRLSDAGQLAAIAIGVFALPAIHLPLAETDAALLALLGSSIAAIVVALGWRCATRRDDARFVTLAATSAALLAIAGAIVAPAWLVAPWIAVVATGLLLLAQPAGDDRVEWSAWVLGAAALVALALAPEADILRALGADRPLGAFAEMTRWLVPALAACLYAWRGRFAHAAAIAQPIAVLLGYVAAAQIVPPPFVPVVPALLLAALAIDRRTLPAMIAAAAITAGWAALPLADWLAAGGGAVLGVPLYVTALPPLDAMLLRLAFPALAAGLVAYRALDLRVRGVALASAAVLATVSLHILFKQLFAIADADMFIRLGMPERTVWQALLAAGALATWRRWPLVARAFGAASLAHILWFSVGLHNPLWAAQAVGAWPVANLLLPAYGLAFALVWAAGRIDLPALADRARGWLQMALIILFAASSLRQLVHGSLLVDGAVGQGEDILRSVLVIALAIGFLRYGIVRAARDWRIASLALMLFAVAKVFLSDAAGLDGLMRIASFAALGFSLIGIGWLYARYLPEEPALTPDSRLAGTPVGGN